MIKMNFDVVMEESEFKSHLDYETLMTKLLKELDDNCEHFIQEYADKYNISFKCAEKFLCKYYNINIGVEVTDGKYYMVFTSQLKPVEEIIVDDTDMSECEQELME